MKRPKSRQLVMEHVWVWEQHNGPVPPGMELHHVNGNRGDNRIENLELVKRLEHKRIHGGCVLIEGNWWKPCRACGKSRPIDVYYKKHGAIMHICRSCAIQRAVMYKQRRRARQAEEEAPVVAEASGEGV